MSSSQSQKDTGDLTQNLNGTGTVTNGDVVSEKAHNQITSVGLSSGNTANKETKLDIRNTPGPRLKLKASAVKFGMEKSMTAFCQTKSSGAISTLSEYKFRSFDKRPLYKLTVELVNLFSKVNPSYEYNSQNIPKRVLTKPMKGVKNDGFDNADNDYILYVNDILGTEGRQWLVLDLLGQGTFGQVVKCRNLKTGQIAAVKVIKNKPAYYNQSLMEVSILEYLTKNYGDLDARHIVKLVDTFLFRNHLCIVFELLSINLYDLIKQNQFKGISLKLINIFMAQILDALCILNEAKVIHCDLKPENILLKGLDAPSIKVIDFGSACFSQGTVYTYIQSRFYRSPEVLLGVHYTSSIDIWSLGCIAMELYLGLPLFPGSSEFNQITRICEMLGLPPTYLLEYGKSTLNFFNKIVTADKNAVYTLKSIEQYNLEKHANEQPSKRYFTAKTLKDLVMNYPMSKSIQTKPDVEKHVRLRECFLDFVSGLLKLNPLERWSPQQAKLHPFITGQPFVGPFTPPMEYSKARRPDHAMPYENDHSYAARRHRASTLAGLNNSAIPQQLQEVVAVSSQILDSRYPTRMKASHPQLGEMYQNSPLQPPPYDALQYGAPRASPHVRTHSHEKPANEAHVSSGRQDNGPSSRRRPGLPTDYEDQFGRKMRSLSVSGNNAEIWIRGQPLQPHDPKYASYHDVNYYPNSNIVSIPGGYQQAPRPAKMTQPYQQLRATYGSTASVEESERPLDTSQDRVNWTNSSTGSLWGIRENEVSDYSSTGHANSAPNTIISKRNSLTGGADLAMTPSSPLKTRKNSSSRGSLHRRTLSGGGRRMSDSMVNSDEVSSSESLNRLNRNGTSAAGYSQASTENLQKLAYRNSFGRTVDQSSKPKRAPSLSDPNGLRFQQQQPEENVSFVSRDEYGNIIVPMKDQQQQPSQQRRVEQGPRISIPTQQQHAQYLQNMYMNSPYQVQQVPQSAPVLLSPGNPGMYFPFSAGISTNGVYPLHHIPDPYSYAAYYGQLQSSASKSEDRGGQKEATAKTRSDPDLANEEK
ncbi:hypothetical protein MP638_002650 [Amoeboaphelidium occidentale]|nr:hypothetical protein MP638_002650 [Amoeboaphelidium occidentale]